MSEDLKIGREEESRRNFGKEFQMVGAAKEKDLFPKPLRFTRGTTKWPASEDRRERAGR